jgi:hypothetical protein
MKLVDVISGLNRPILYGPDGIVRIFADRLDWRFYHLDDFVVSSALSGPSYLLIPRFESKVPVSDSR